MYSSRSKPHSFSMLLISLVKKLSGKDLYKLFSSPVPLDALIKRALLFRLFNGHGRRGDMLFMEIPGRCISWFGIIFSMDLSIFS